MSTNPEMDAAVADLRPGDWVTATFAPTEHSGETVRRAGTYTVAGVAYEREDWLCLGDQNIRFPEDSEWSRQAVVGLVSVHVLARAAESAGINITSTTLPGITTVSVNGNVVRLDKVREAGL